MPDSLESDIDCVIHLDNDEIKHLNIKLSYDIISEKKFTYIVVNDITERYISELKIKQLTQAIAQSPTSIIISDKEGKIEYVNPAFELIYNYKTKEVIGKTPRILKSGRTPKAIYEDLWQTIKSGKNWEGELVNRNSKGEYIWVSSHISPLFNDDGQIIKFVSVQLNITGRKKLDDELLKAKEKAESGERLKSAFIENVSHEVRTPLNAIHGFSQLFKAFLKPGEKQYKFAMLIEKNAKILLTLFEDILEYSKIEAQTLEFKEEPIDISLLLPKLASRYNTKNIIEHQKPIEIFIEQEKDDNHTKLNVDRKYFIRIFDNLVANSIKFTEEGSIRIGYAINLDYVEFFVKDTGVGISDEDKDIVFEAFSHGTKQFVTLHKGTGLGLSITRKLVKMMGGDIWFSSEEGVGTSFHFTIPAEKIIGTKEYEQYQYQEHPFKGSKVLVAEDNMHSYMLLEAILLPTGIEVLRAKDGNQAINLFDEFGDQVDVVLMDIMMPVLDGIKATRLIRKKSDVPVYALSAVEDNFIDSERELFNGFIRKPISKELLMLTLEQVLKDKN